MKHLLSKIFFIAYVTFSLFGEEEFFSPPTQIKTNISHEDLKPTNIIVKSKKRKAKKINKKKHMKNLINKNKNSHNIDVEEFESESGIKIRFVKKPDTHIVTIYGAFLNTGQTYETVNVLTNTLTLSMKLSDTEKYSYEEILNIANSKGISFSISDASEALILKLRYVSMNEKIAHEITKQILYKSKLNGTPLAKEQLINQYKDQIQNPAFRLTKKVSKEMFGDHPYGKVTIDSDFEKIKQEEISEAYKSTFNRKNLIVVVVGNFQSNDEVSALVDNIFAELPEKSEQKYFSQTVQKVEPKSFATIEEYQKDYRNNKIFFFLNKAPEISSKESIPLAIALTAFSKIPLENRLIDVLRKKLGKVYYSRFNIDYGKYSNYFFGSTESSDYETTKDTIVFAFRDFQNTSISETEFQDAKHYIVSSHVFNIIDGNGIAKNLIYIWKNEFDKNYINTYYEDIKNCSLDDVKKVIQKYFNPDNISFGVITKDN